MYLGELWYYWLATCSSSWHRYGPLHPWKGWVLQESRPMAKEVGSPDHGTREVSLGPCKHSADWWLSWPNAQVRFVRKNRDIEKLCLGRFLPSHSILRFCNLDYGCRAARSLETLRKSSVEQSRGYIFGPGVKSRPRILMGGSNLRVAPRSEVGPFAEPSSRIIAV